MTLQVDSACTTHPTQELINGMKQLLCVYNTNKDQQILNSLKERCKKLIDLESDSCFSLRKVTQSLPPEEITRFNRIMSEFIEALQKQNHAKHPDLESQLFDLEKKTNQELSKTSFEVVAHIPPETLFQLVGGFIPCITRIASMRCLINEINKM